MHLRTEIRETLRLALPITFAQLALMTMGLVDVAIVGRKSELDMAAVSAGNQFAFSMLCPAMGVTMAVEPLASQAIGAGDPDRAWRSLRAGVYACLLLSPPTMLLMYASTFVMEPLRVDPSIVPLARDFVLARLPGAPGWLLFMAGKAYLEARGLTRPLFLGGWASNVLNFAWCALLVYGDGALAKVGLPALGIPALGSVGAGIATSLANLTLAAIALGAAWLARPEGARLFGRVDDDLRESIRKLVRVGVPIGLQILTEVGVFALVGVLVGRLGARTLAAHQIALGLASFTFMGVLGMSGATAVRVGRAIGAREEGGPRRAGMVGVGLSAIYMACCAIVFVVAPEPLARIFSRESDVLGVAVTLVRIAAVFQIADGIQGCLGGALRGAADTKFASWANVVCHWAIGLPLAIFLGFFLGRGAVGLWWGLCAGLFSVAAVLLVRFFRISSRTIEAV